MMDDLYDYSTFETKRVHDIFTAWDGLGGYHGLLIRKCADLLVGSSVLDVGCGLCHLYEAFKNRHNKPIPHYVGVEVHNYVYALAKKRYPNLQIYKENLYSLPSSHIKGLKGGFDTVYAIGLYRNEPVDRSGLLTLTVNARKAVILTYFAKDPGVIPKIIHKLRMRKVEIIQHNIDSRLEIVRLWC